MGREAVRAGEVDTGQGLERHDDQPSNKYQKPTNDTPKLMIPHANPPRRVEKALGFSLGAEASGWVPVHAERNES